MYRVPGGYPEGTGRVPGGSPQFAFSRKLPHTAPPKKLASSCARPAAALRDQNSFFTVSGPRLLRVHFSEARATQTQCKYSKTLQFWMQLCAVNSCAEWERQ